jgi:hypothetical protein
MSRTCACDPLPPRLAERFFLYPWALQVPGTQHILDTVLKDGLERIPWWVGWESASKAVCQWVHPRPRREYLQTRLPAKRARPIPCFAARVREVRRLAVEKTVA